MATKTITTLVSDLSGDTIQDGGQTVEFSVRGVDYTIDLTDKEAAGFDNAIAMYISHATRVGGRAKRGSGGSTRRDASQTKAIKAWADKQGMEYPQRGRLPQTLLDAYEAAHKS